LIGPSPTVNNMLEDRADITRLRPAVLETMAGRFLTVILRGDYIGSIGARAAILPAPDQPDTDFIDCRLFDGWEGNCADSKREIWLVAETFKHSPPIVKGRIRQRLVRFFAPRKSYSQLASN
jgi:hypothetical protein